MYPARFELFSASELIDGFTRLQRHSNRRARPRRQRASATSRSFANFFWDCRTRNIPCSTKKLIWCSRRRRERTEQSSELLPAGITDEAEAFAGAGSAEEAGGEDPTGMSAATMLGNMIPTIF